MSKYLGLDSSTQSLTGTIIDTEERIIVLEESVNFDDHFRIKYGVENGVLDLGRGQIHSPPLMWTEALDLLMQQLQERGQSLATIAAVAGSGQQHGTVYLNASADNSLAKLDPTRPLATQLQHIFSRQTAPIWMDTSTETQCRQIETAVGGRQALLRLTGNVAYERFSGPQIRKFHQTEPNAYTATTHIALVSSYMASLLAGKIVPVESSDASGTNLMDITARRWSPAALDAAAPQLERRLLPVTDPRQFAGKISPYYVSRYGFSPACEILPFSGDNPSSLIGLGLTKPGRVALSLGTSDTLFACIDTPRPSTLGEGALFASPDGANYMALICFLNGSLAREAVLNACGLDWTTFTRALTETPPGNGGGVMLPYFGPEIVPRVNAGVIRQGIDVDDVEGNVRAVVEAQALSSKIHSAWMGIDIHSLYVTGGASVNTEILQVYADVHGCPVHRYETANAAALGAALRASYSHRRRNAEACKWADVVGPFTQPVTGSAVRPRTTAVATYTNLLDTYRQLEERHTH